MGFWEEEVRTNRLSLQFGLGHTSNRSKQEKSRLGVNLGLNFQKGFSKYSLNSNNIYGSACYPGQRRGYLSFNERISRQVGKKANAWLSVNYDRSAPESLPESSRFTSWEFSRNTALVGIYFNELIKHISVGLKGSFIKKRIIMQA